MEFDVMMLPRINAILNSIATVMLITGFVFIKRGKWKAHRNSMLAAFGISVLFLVSYVTYHALRGGMNTPFGGEGAFLVGLYRFILFSHIVLAAIVPFLAIITLHRGLQKRYVHHKKIARWTFPIWLYVSITGVIVYLMLYEWFPGSTSLWIIRGEALFPCIFHLSVLICGRFGNSLKSGASLCHHLITSILLYCYEARDILFIPVRICRPC